MTSFCKPPSKMCGSSGNEGSHRDLFFISFFSFLFLSFSVVHTYSTGHTKSYELCRNKIKQNKNIKKGFLRRTCHEKLLQTHELQNTCSYGVFYCVIPSPCTPTEMKKRRRYKKVKKEKRKKGKHNQSVRFIMLRNTGLRSNFGILANSRLISL